MLSPRSILGTRQRFGGALVVAVLAVGVSGRGQHDKVAGASTPPGQSGVEFAATSTVSELSSTVASLLDRPLVTPSVEPDPDADELATGAAAVAITSGIDLGDGTATGYRIVFDPQALDQAGDDAGRALLAHEVAHLYLQPVTDAATPLWLVEGIADFVGYRAAGTDLDSVRAAIAPPASVPTDLPDDAAFSSPDPQVQASAYAQAWLALEYLAQTIGEPGTIALFRAVAASPTPNEALDQQLLTSLGVDRSGFVQQWLTYLDGVL